MSDKQNLFNRLTKIKNTLQGKGMAGEAAAAQREAATPKAPPTAAPAASPAAPPARSVPRGTPAAPASPRNEGPKGDQLDNLLDRLTDVAPGLLKQKGPKGNGNSVAGGAVGGGGPNRRTTEEVKVPPPAASPPLEEFFPEEPASFRDAGLNDGMVEELILKYLLATGENSGQAISEQLRLSFPLISDFLSKLKYDQLVQYRGTTSMNDYICSLTDLGRERARRHSMRCSYFGAAPVPIQQYRESVARQSLVYQSPSEEDLRRAFSDLLIERSMLLRLGAAMNSGRGMFLFGSPGNGKTSIAERVTKAFGEFIWIPRAIGVDGEIVRVFDPIQHEEAPLDNGGDFLKKHKIDHRWVRIRRPTIVVGGELTMANLELSVNPATGINEAPVQVKSNCGTLVIDDFGRQRMSVDELLNRWIVPLEKRVDFLNLPSGKKIEMPFDQLVIFSTNLEPKDLVDDAFLRRIPYKINVGNPSEAAFRRLFEIMSPKMGVAYDAAAIDHLIDTHYRPTKRPFRCCHPRDLLLQIVNYCRYQRQPATMNAHTFDFAAENYFSML